MSGIDTLAERLAQVDADTLFDELAARLERIVPFDASRFFGTDPSTLLATFPARIDGVANNQCHAYCQREFLVEDADLFRDLARAPAFARPSMGSRRARSPSPRRSSVGWPRTLTREPTKRCSMPCSADLVQVELLADALVGRHASQPAAA